MILKFNLRKASPVRVIVTMYAVAVIVSTLLLILPISLKPGVKLSLMDAFFTAMSAISVTGLTVVNTAETFSPLGVLFLMLTIQLGGIGIMTLSTLIWIILGNNIGLSQRRLIAIDQNRFDEYAGLVKLMKLVFGLAILIEGIGGVLFSAYFLFTGLADKWYEAFYYGFFHALSSYTNAGFDLFGNSLISLSGDYFVIALSMILMTLGAIGFPVLVELREYFLYRKENFRFSLFTKVTVFTYFFLLVFGALAIYIMEKDYSFAGMSWDQQLFFSLFNSSTTRSTGLSTMDVSVLTPSVQFLLSILMFIGASPSSVGGGIRTTTLAVLVLTLYTYAKGNREVRIFRRRIAQEDIMKSFVVFAAGIFLLVSSVAIIEYLEGQRFSLMQIIFEASSAFGTCGLSMGITSDLSAFSKVLISILMFIGRVGIFPLLMMVRSNKKQSRIQYPEERIIIG